MAKWGVSIGEELFKGQRTLPSDVSSVIAAQIYEVFVDMVKGSPQYSGNFTANLSLTAGDRATRKVVSLPIPDTAAEALRRGHETAVDIAVDGAKNSIKNMRKAWSGLGAWWLSPSITIYNRLDYAEAVEALDEKELREVNKGAANPIKKARAEMQSRALDIILFGSAEFERLKNLV